jgi:hypothetical protein
MRPPDFILYTGRTPASGHAESLANTVAAASIEVVPIYQVPADQRPRWLRGVPTLVRYGAQTPWRGPVWEGSHALATLREMRPPGADDGAGKGEEQAMVPIAVADAPTNVEFLPDGKALVGLESTMSGSTAGATDAPLMTVPEVEEGPPLSTAEIDKLVTQRF